MRVVAKGQDVTVSNLVHEPGLDLPTTSYTDTALTPMAVRVPS